MNKSIINTSNQASRLKHQSMAFGNRVGRNSALGRILLTIIIFCLVSLVFSAEGLPDYESYESIYMTGGFSFEQNSNELLFVALNKGGLFLGLNYEQFRSILLLMSAGLLSVSLILTDRWLNDIKFHSNIISLKINPLAIIIVSAALMIFMLEFYQIRVRAGLALSLASLAFSIYLTAKRPNSLATLSSVAAVLFFGYGIHASTTIVLGYFLFSPFIYELLLSKFRNFYFAPIFRFVIIVLMAIISLYIVSEISSRSVERGENLYSPLNVVRLICISAVPLVLFVVDYMLMTFATKSNSTTNNTCPAIGYDRRISWVRYSTICYLLFALALLVLFSIGELTKSGEAIVRIFTLSSVTAIFVIMLRAHRYLWIWFYLFVINSLFFVNTLLTPMRAAW